MKPWVSKLVSSFVGIEHRKHSGLSLLVDQSKSFLYQATLFISNFLVVKQPNSLHRTLFYLQFPR